MRRSWCANLEWKSKLKCSFIWTINTAHLHFNIPNVFTAWFKIFHQVTFLIKFNYLNFIHKMSMPSKMRYFLRNCCFFFSFFIALCKSLCPYVCLFVSNVIWIHKLVFQPFFGLQKKCFVYYKIYAKFFFYSIDRLQ